MQRSLLLLLIFFLSCGSTSRLPETNLIGENNKDVLVLSSLIRNYLRQEKGRNFDVNEWLKSDSLARISNNFEKAEMKTNGAYISVYYKFSKSRNADVVLTSKEKELLSWIRWSTKDFTADYDGEIRFDYGERFYHIKKIVVKKE